MNVLKKGMFRTLQVCSIIALPLLPYKNPVILNKILEVVEIVKKSKRVLLVTDHTIRKLGLTNYLENDLRNENIQCFVYDRVVENPTTNNVEEALAMYKENNCEAIIAFGGGSPMDCAKAVGARVARPKKSLKEMKGVLKIRRKTPLFIAIPTTAGTGSETTLAAVIVDSETRHKYAINDFALIPDYAVLDEEVTMSLPKHIVAMTGMDALTHAVESYIGNGGNRSTKKDALEAIKLIFENLEESYSSGTSESRKNMLLASHKAGRSFTRAYVGYVHALAHPLGGKYNVPHGLANAIILPIVLKEYGAKIHKKLYEIAIYCNLIDKNAPYEDGAKIVIGKIQTLNRIFDIPDVIKEIKEEDIKEMALYAYKEANPLYPCPILWDKKQLEKIYYRIGNL